MRTSGDGVQQDILSGRTVWTYTGSITTLICGGVSELPAGLAAGRSSNQA
jgi:hypothetical protein